MVSTVGELADYLVARGIATPQTLVGCTPDEVAEVRVAQRVDALPEQYEQFLLRMGRKTGDLMRGTDLRYPKVVELADEMHELVEELGWGSFIVPGSTMVAMHGGYQLYWVEPGGAAHLAEEMKENPVRSWPSLVDCLVFEADMQRK
ncbi:hypothetical protein [Labedaea rhizosphaerae]|uniref:SUKH superfamily protein n=1 Tax=Labedaea rhizosphaerae TaxID=598644 RepID=A0A4R6SH74_LABRH|nr:hypothetical protein [Labedaea rhizosphaerae]TDQ00957.1 hypothetical protein EV186_102823 [Labedaea rhizosphaerae]